jgi:Methyltransferase domain
MAVRLRSKLAVRSRLRPAWYRLLERLMRRAGYQIVRANYYSPIPEFRKLPQSTWDEAAPMPGLELDLDAQIEMVEQEVAPHIAEFDPPWDPPGNEEGFYLGNPFYLAVDAALLYAMVRQHRPPQVLEIGAGFSTLVISGAGRRNTSEGASLKHRVVDPFPSPMLESIRDRIELRQASATDVEIGEFKALEAGDLLFIDTTHTVKAGGDVIYLILEALPQLAPGVLVHIHDFFRPFEYPRVLYEAFGLYWQEHYLLQALLAFNPNFEVLCASHALARLRADQLRAVIPILGEPTLPSSLWLRKTA